MIAYRSYERHIPSDYRRAMRRIHQNARLAFAAIGYVTFGLACIFGLAYAVAYAINDLLPIIDGTCY